jgi:hypothetical protein
MIPPQKSISIISIKEKFIQYKTTTLNNVMVSIKVND